MGIPVTELPIAKANAAAAELTAQNPPRVDHNPDVQKDESAQASSSDANVENFSHLAAGGSIQ